MLKSQLNFHKEHVKVSRVEAVEADVLKDVNC